MDKSKKHTGPVRTEQFIISGIVQGVGFRPFVHRLAVTHELGGYILNDPGGVTIEVTGNHSALDRFARELEDSAPPLARIVSVTRTVIHADVSASPAGRREFEIRKSVLAGETSALIPPDVCVCEDCLAELFDPHDRRYLYPFINCTNCGPRYTIIRNLPYDRPQTTMASFTMCPHCGAEYTNHTDRRYHAQPNACPVCGPRVELWENRQTAIPDNPIIGAIRLLREGKILAIKGLGGFHLAVDATNEAAVSRLRQRKHREEKPLALMCGTLDDVRNLVALTPGEERILMSSERPIVLANRVAGGVDAPNVAPGIDQIGVMLPYTPLHYTLFFHPEAGGDYHSGTTTFPCLVMTSGNLSDEPICRTNDEAFDRLAGIADAFLIHNRDIHVRCDDSVVRAVPDGISFIRRSRGYVPVPVFLHKPVGQVLAFGGELKNTLCLTDGTRAFTSHHIGDLENATTLDMFREAAAHFQSVLDIQPTLFAYDLHPNYLATRYFMEMRDTLDPERYGAVGVQHHHAHIAGVLAENGRDEQVIGFALDGTGYGLDGNIWGGEVIVANRCGFARAAHLAPMPLPGGDTATRNPWRMAFSYLRAAFGDDWRGLDIPALRQAGKNSLELLERACSAGINAPLTTSLGRLFDAVASILDIRHSVAYEGQAAILLDMAAHDAGPGSPIPYRLIESPAEEYAGYPERWGTLTTFGLPPSPQCPVTFTIDVLPFIRALVEGIESGKAVAGLAADFHATMLAIFSDIATRLRELTGIETVAVSGGSWQNRIFSDRFPALIRQHGFDYIENRLVPPNDGGLALGQAYVASGIAAMKKKRG